MTRAPLPSAAEVTAMLAPIKARYASDQEYRTALAQAQITEAELSEHLLAGLRMLRYTDLRFRPEVQLSEETLRAFYDKLAEREIVTRLQSFEASRNDIEKLLTDQQAMQALDRWLGMTRSETRDSLPRGGFQMTRARHLTRQILVAVAILVVICAVTGLLVVRSGWFRELVRQRIVTEIEAATGGRVEVGNFSFKWETLVAKISPLVLHGTEPASDTPLLRVESVSVGLRVSLLLERKFDLSSAVFGSTQCAS